MKKQKGITLIDLLMGLGIASILLGAGIPAFNELIERKQIVAEVQELRAVLQYGRTQAVEQRKNITLCPSSDGQNCNSDWSNGYILFVDQNGDRTLSSPDELLRYEQIKEESITLRWRAFGVRSSLQWTASGITNHQNGLFEFCFKDRPKLARALIISKSGRIRHSEDSNGNEIHEDSTDEDISCN